MNDQDKNFKYFIENHKDIYNKYPNSFVVIANERVVLSAPSFEEALDDAIKNGLEPGNFLVQQCTEGSEAYTQEFHSRVVFL